MRSRLSHPRLPNRPWEATLMITDPLQKWRRKRPGEIRPVGPSTDARAAPRVAAIHAADGELAAGARAVFVVTAQAGPGVEPETGGAVDRGAARMKGPG